MMVSMTNKNISKKQARKVLAERDPYVGIVLEEISGQLKTVLEGQGVSDKRIDRLHGAVSRLEVGVEKLDTRLISVEIEVKDLNKKFDMLGAKKADREEVQALDVRVTKLEESAA
jgi:hypothetical protein